MSEELPGFPYHPDPLATGTVVASNTTCFSCGRARGFIYTGPVYAVEDFPTCCAHGASRMAARLRSTTRTSSVTRSGTMSRLRS
ncbi:CbrC family protein [Streptomyces sp. NPDC057362]|uniref:CbrC family protein n=1 Tax=unclassified Streptomyces TaxID=2593676 RepID=UPI00362D0F4D